MTHSFKLWLVGSSSLIRDRTWAPCIGSAESYLLLTREVPRLHFKLGAVFKSSATILEPK